MITRRTRGKVTWIDMECPTPDELQDVMAEYGIDSRIEEEIVTPTPYPLVVSFPKYLYMILHFPTTDMGGGARNQEIDFIVGKNFLITARYEVIESLYNLQRVFEAEELIGIKPNEHDTAELLERVLRRMYGAIRQEAEHLGEVLERIEKDIFSGKERQAVRNISDASRILLRFDTALGRHTESLEVFLTGLEGTAFFGKRFKDNALHIKAQRDHVAALVASYKAVAHELRQTNDSLLNTSQNDVMKTLTVMTFVTFPPIVIAGLFGMNIEPAFLPIVHHPMGFTLILLLMIFCSSLVYLFFRVKKWL